MSGAARNLHVICERDVGLFSLFQQVVATLPWALGEGRVPVAYFGARCSYWTPEGFEGASSVWEYYFEPLVPGHGAATIPPAVREIIDRRVASVSGIGFGLDGNIWVSKHFGDHRALAGKALRIPYRWDDPGAGLRQVTAGLIRAYVRPRPYIRARVAAFAAEHFRGRQVIGVHLRGTDAVSPAERRAHRQDSLVLENYVRAIDQLLGRMGDALIFTATDAEDSLVAMRRAFGDRVVACESIRHTGGPAAGAGPTGALMPAYVAGDRRRAARNGAEAVIEYLLLCQCHHLVHNGASLARTVLLTRPDLPHTNVHRPSRIVTHLRMVRRRGVRGAARAIAGSVYRLMPLPVRESEPVQRIRGRLRALLV